MATFGHRNFLKEAFLMRVVLVILGVILLGPQVSYSWGGSAEPLESAMRTYVQAQGAQHVATTQQAWCQAAFQHTPHANDFQVIDLTHMVEIMWHNRSADPRFSTVTTWVQARNALYNAATNVDNGTWALGPLTPTPVQFAHFPAGTPATYASLVDVRLNYSEASERRFWGPAIVPLLCRLAGYIGALPVRAAALPLTYFQEDAWEGLLGSLDCPGTASACYNNLLTMAFGLLAQP